MKCMKTFFILCLLHTYTHKIEEWLKQQVSNIMINSTSCRERESIEWHKAYIYTVLIVCFTRWLWWRGYNGFRMLSSALVLLLIARNERIYKFHTLSLSQANGRLLFRKSQLQSKSCEIRFSYFNLSLVVLAFLLTCLAFVFYQKLYKLNEAIRAVVSVLVVSTYIHDIFIIIRML